MVRTAAKRRSGYFRMTKNVSNTRNMIFISAPPYTIGREDHRECKNAMTTRSTQRASVSAQIVTTVCIGTK